MAITDVPTDDTRLDFEVEEVAEVPKIEREQPKSKYHQLFDMAEASDTGIVSFTVPDEEGDDPGKRASARASYLRRIEPGGFDVLQRGDKVYVKALSEQEIADREADTNGDGEADTDEWNLDG